MRKILFGLLSFTIALFAVAPAQPTYAATLEPIRANVAVVVYYGGHKSGHKFDYQALIKQTENGIENASKFRGYKDSSALPNIDYKIVQTKVIRDAAPQLGGSCDQYLSKVHSGSWTEADWKSTKCWGSGTAHYRSIISTNAICDAVNAGEVDELWLFGFNAGGFYESNMAGKGAYWTNGSVITGTSCKKSMHIMGFNYELPVDFALHSFGHRMETIFQVNAGIAPYKRFIRKNACGDVHNPPNAAADYDYVNKSYVTTNCEDWNWDSSGASRKLNCTRWDCTHAGYMTWWFQNIPGAFSNLRGYPAGPRNIWGYFLHSERYYGEQTQKLTAMHRFWSANFQTHFYTNSEAEKTALINSDPNWAYEGEVYKVVAISYGTCSLPRQISVFRFWNLLSKRHFYTTNKAERDQLQQNPEIWQYEGAKFCAYAEKYPGRTAVFRFFSEAKKAHFYTIYTAERDAIIANDSSWQYEGEVYFTAQ